MRLILKTSIAHSPQEWGVGLICTVVSSLAGGSFIIVKWGLHEWVTDVWGMIALGGFFFVCGLPGWALVRWIFNFIDKQEGKTIVEVIKEFKLKLFDHFNDRFTFLFIYKIKNPTD